MDRVLSSIISIAAKPLISSFLSALSSWTAAGAASLVSELGKALLSSSTVSLSGGFVAEFGLIVRLSAELVAPLLLVSLIQAIYHQDLSQLIRTMLVKLPAALMLSWASIEVVALALQATDQMSVTVLKSAGTSASAFFASLSTTLGQLPNLPGLSGFADLLVVLFAAVVSFVLWLELAIRSAAVAVATLFIPLSLSGLVWPVTSHWARRLGETIAALVLSKLVIVAVLALAIVTIGNLGGASGIVQGSALLVLAAFSPFSLLRLIPAVEHGAVSQLEELGRAGMRVARRGVNSALLTTGAPGDLGAQAPELAPIVADIGYFDGDKEEALFGRDEADMTDLLGDRFVRDDLEGNDT